MVNEITFTPLTINGKVRGYISNERVNSERICDFLDSLQYTSHNPSTKSVEYSRWIDYANSYQVSSFTSRAEHNDHSALISVKRCPYSLAAYLRFWNHVSEEESLNENALFVFDSPSLWRDFRESTPEFHIVIRCGVKSEIKLNTAGGEITINRIHRSVNSEGTLVTQLWGAAKVGIINMPINYWTTMLTDFYQFQKIRWVVMKDYQTLDQSIILHYFQSTFWKALIKKHSMVLLSGFPEAVQNTLELEEVDVNEKL